MPKRALTSAAVDRLKLPVTGQVEHFDAGYPGLALRLSYGGSRSWVYFYRLHGKQRRLTIGTYPALGLAAAREAWREARKAVELGNDPAAAKTEAKQRRPDIVRNVGADFIERYHRKGKKNRTADEVERMLEMHLYPTLGDKDMKAVTRRDILDLLDAAEKKRPGAGLNRILANVRRFFGWAVERDIILTSPVVGIKSPAIEQARDRVLSDDELRAFLRACDRLKAPFGPLFRLLLLTAQRRDEVAAVTWSEIDMNAAVWALPKERTKNKRSHEVPLSQQAISELADLLRSRANDLVFPALRSRSARQGEREARAPRSVSGFGRAKERLDTYMVKELQKMAEERGADPEKVVLPDWRLHDLRRTAASGMARIGISVHVVEKLLNHVSGTFSGVLGIYQRHEFAEEKRAAAQAWGDFLEGLISARPGNVVQLAETK